MNHPSAWIAKLPADVLPGSRKIRETHSRPLRQGFEFNEAANLVAYLKGLRVGDASWTLGEINRVLFLRHLYRSGRLAEAGQAAAPGQRGLTIDFSLTRQRTLSSSRSSAKRR